jgi:sphingosine kinase
MDLLASVNGAAKGGRFWSDNVSSFPSSLSSAMLNRILQLKYFKAHAYRVKPLNANGYMTVDGENFPFEEFQVESHPGLATLLSPRGYYAADFPPEPPSTT